MYTPSFNRIDDRALLIEGMRAWSFAILFGPNFDSESRPESGSESSPDAQGQPIATHLPLVVADEGEHGTLEGHFARANPHWKSLAGRETLVVFSGPHSYVSPSLYANPQSVPTWNYIAIHATGKLELVEDDAGKEDLLKKLIEVHEPPYAAQWNELPESFRHSMLHGIVGFRIPLTRVEGKFKLSQNRPDADRRNVRAAHATGTPDQQALAAWMNRLDPQ
jgi:transcriptional regulator